MLDEAVQDETQTARPPTVDEAGNADGGRPG